MTLLFNHLELELYISKQDNIFNENVISEFKKAGMVRRVVTRIWNREGAFRVGILFEYTGEKAYKGKTIRKVYLQF